MKEFIQAQGATHVTEARLKQVVAQINNERMSRTWDTENKRKQSDRICDIIKNQYGCNISEFNIKPNMMSFTVEEKYDGYSYLNTEGRFFSKSLSTAKATKGQPVDKTSHVPHLADTFKRVYELCGADLHGELYVMGGTSDDVTKILGCNYEKAIQRQKGDNYLNYMLIDIRAIHGISLVNEPHRVRRAILEYVYRKYIEPFNGFIRLAQEFNNEDPCDVFSRIVMNGGEGIMIKDESGLYIPGKKPVGNWIKGKKKITHDVFITGLNDGTGKNANMFGSFRFAQMVGNDITECGSCSSGLSDEMRKYIYDNADELISDRQVVEIEAIQESVKSFRNAVFLRLRDDKHYTECTPETIRVKKTLV